MIIHPEILPRFPLSLIIRSTVEERKKRGVMAERLIVRRRIVTGRIDFRAALR